MTRFAFKITEEVIDLAAQMTGSDSVEFPDELYLVVTMLSPAEFYAKLTTTDEVFEEYRKDPDLQIV